MVMTVEMFAVLPQVNCAKPAVVSGNSKKPGAEFFGCLSHVVSLTQA